jgi:hypothetical protein
MPEMHNQPPSLGKITFQNNHMYSHATLSINYTSYNVRCQHDVINPRTPCHFVLLPAKITNDPAAHPFIYVQVLGIYHAHIQYCSHPPKRMEFLWVQWLDYDEEEPGGWEVDQMDRVFYSKCQNDKELLDSFGFVDPKDIVCTCHLILDFDSGTINMPHAARLTHANNDEWKFLYVNQ